MSLDGSETRRRQTIAIAILGGALILLVGAVVGFLIAGEGGPSEPPAGTASPTTSAATTSTSTTTTRPVETTVPASQQGPLSDGVIIPVDEDTYVDSGDPGERFGASPILEIEREQGETRWALLRFQVTGVAEGGVERAILRLFQLDGSDDTGLLNQVGGPWGEAETTWANAPPVGDPLAVLPSGPDGTWLEIELTGVVTGPGPVDFYLTISSDDGLDYASKESGPNAPVLVISPREGSVPSDTIPPSEEAGTGVLVGAGDIAYCAGQGDEATAALIEEVLVEGLGGVVFTTGDNAYESGSAESFARCYDPSWGQFREVTRPTPGSREYLTEEASAYFEYFGPNAGNEGEGYYSYDLSGWHVVALNSNCRQIGGCDEGSPQMEWLRADLAARSTACTLAYWHHPLFSSSRRGANPQVLPLFRILHEHGAELVINGRDHFYEQFAPQAPDGTLDPDGVVQFTVGTGGRSLHSFGQIHSNSKVRFNGAFGVLRLDLHPGGYGWEFMSVPGAGFADEGTGVCR